MVVALPCWAASAGIVVDLSGGRGSREQIGFLQDRDELTTEADECRLALAWGRGCLGPGDADLIVTGPGLRLVDQCPGGGLHLPARPRARIRTPRDGDVESAVRCAVDGDG